jgi:hypothetical protein
MITEYIEKTFGSFLQSKISFDINGKSIKKGKLILIAIKDFHVFFILQTDSGDNKQFIIPMPFGISKNTADTITLDYTHNTLCRGNKDILLKLRTVSKKKNTRFFNIIMHCKKIN